MKLDEMETYITTLVRSCVENNFGINIMSNTRERPYPDARKIYFYMVRKFLPKMPLSVLGTTIGNFHHSTVIHNIEKHEWYCMYDASYNARFENIMRDFNLKSGIAEQDMNLLKDINVEIYNLLKRRREIKNKIK